MWLLLISLRILRMIFMVHILVRIRFAKGFCYRRTIKTMTDNTSMPKQLSQKA